MQRGLPSQPMSSRRRRRLHHKDHTRARVPAERPIVKALQKAIAISLHRPAIVTLPLHKQRFRISSITRLPRADTKTRSLLAENGVILP